MAKNNTYLKNTLNLLMFLIVLFSVSSSVFADSTNSLWGLQQKVTAAVLDRKEEYAIKYTGNNIPSKYQIRTVLQNAINVDDYIHYNIDTYAYEGTGYKGNYNLKFSFQYHETLAETAAVNAKIKSVLAELGVQNMNEYQKEKAIHDWIVSHVAYDTTYTRNTAYDAITPPYTTVCQGYSLLAHKMFKSAGLSSRIIVGYSKGQSHSWNLVKVDGRWYQIDLTWNDPVPDENGRVVYDYFNLTDTEMKSNHLWSGNYPAANSEFSNVLKLKILNDPAKKDIYQKLLSVISADINEISSSSEIKSKVKNAINTGKTTVKFLLADKYSMASYINEAMRDLRIGIKYSYKYSDYLRTENPNDVLIDFKIESLN